jgi:hypothetical protein
MKDRSTIPCDVIIHDIPLPPSAVRIARIRADSPYLRMNAIAVPGKPVAFMRLSDRLHPYGTQILPSPCSARRALRGARKAAMARWARVKKRKPKK